MVMVAGSTIGTTKPVLLHKTIESTHIMWYHHDSFLRLHSHGHSVPHMHNDHVHSHMVCCIAAVVSMVESV